jgi:hypothetical protein
VWCYGCLTGEDCAPGQSCFFTRCDDYCYGEASCHAGQVCGYPDELCHASCDGGVCPAGEVCDLQDTIGNGPGLCYQCLSPTDCPSGQGCDSRTHLCGGCTGPDDRGDPDDCPPGAICSNYWRTRGLGVGVCLQSCDVFACSNPSDLCAVLPSLTPDHKYCFGCLSDADCADAGPGAFCDNSAGLTFTCMLP